ncbi:peptidase family C69-domain-containing protein [Pelagophyceae sp. CCMP2097]|nr:peptidase family C69-domain-containing protein [Pelagophyceae sp. CCMP2097]
MSALLALALLAAPAFGSEGSCTTIVVGRDATDFGGTIATHTADCFNCDFRLARVAAAQQREGGDALAHSVRRFKATYPTEVSGRAETWAVANLEYADLGVDESAPPFRDATVAKAQKRAWASAAWAEDAVLGVANLTGLVEGEEFSHLEALYGIANDAGLAIGESTCEGALLGKVPRTCATCGGPLWDVSALTRVAMRYCATARCAIDLMGALAVRDGYYIAELVAGEAGEALTVADGVEAWVFHVLPDDTGFSAVWVARRVNAGHVAVVANSFVIRGVPRDCAETAADADFRCGPGLEAVALRASIARRDAHGDVDFAATFGPRPDNVAFPYSTRRVWRVMSLAAPVAIAARVAEHSRDYLGGELPFSVAVEKPLAVRDILAMQRDHYEGTPMDLTRGIAAGPWGDPTRFDLAYQGAGAPEARDVQPTKAEALSGGGRFERAVSMFRTSYSFAAASAPGAAPVIWFAQGAPHAAVYAPVLVDGDVPSAFSRGSLFEFSWESSWWATDLVANWMRANVFRFAAEDVAEAQRSVEGAFEARLADFGGDATAFNARAAGEALDAWHALFFKLVAKYRDGYRQARGDVEVAIVKYFYPKVWLDSVGFFSPVGDYDGVGATQPTPAPWRVAGHESAHAVALLAFAFCLGAVAAAAVFALFGAAKAPGSGSR